MPVESSPTQSEAPVTVKAGSGRFAKVLAAGVLAAALAGGGVYWNQAAQEREATALLVSIQKDLAEGDLDSARESLDRLAVLDGTQAHQEYSRLYRQYAGMDVENMAKQERAAELAGLEQQVRSGLKADDREAVFKGMDALEKMDGEDAAALTSALQKELERKDVEHHVALLRGALEKQDVAEARKILTRLESRDVSAYTDMAPLRAEVDKLALAKLRWEYISTFSDGLALVQDDSGMYFINEAGEVALDAKSWTQVASFSGGLAAVQKDGKCGYINTSGELELPLQWEAAMGFQDGMARVKLGGKWGVINAQGKYVVQPQWDEVEPFSEGRARVKLGGKYGFVSEQGEIVGNVDFDYAYNFSEGLAYVSKGVEKYFIGRMGNDAVRESYDFKGNFSEGLSSVQQRGEKDACYYIDKRGVKVLHLPGVSWAGEFSGGVARVRSAKSGYYGYVDKRGKVISPAQWLEAHDYAEGLAVVKDGSQFANYQYIDLTGKEVGERWGKAHSFKEGRGRVRRWMTRDGKGTTYVDQAGKRITSEDFNEGKDFSDGLAAVKQGSKWGYIGRDGKWAIRPQWDDLSSFRKGYATVKQGGKVGVIDKTGKYVLPLGTFDAVTDAHQGRAVYAKVLDREKRKVEWGFVNLDEGKSYKSKIEFQDAADWDGGLVRLQKEGKWGLVNTQFAVASDFQWDEIGDFSGGMARVKKGGKYGYVNERGLLVIDARLDSAGDFSDGLALVGERGRQYYMAKDGSKQLYAQWRVTSLSYNGGCAAVQGRDGYWKMIDKDGKMLYELECDFLTNPGEGRGAFRRGGKWGLVDKSGKVVVEPQWQSAGRYKEGLARVQLEDKWGFIDIDGKIVVEPQWEAVLDFKEGLAAVQLDGEWGFINAKGEVVVPPRWENVTTFKNGHSIVTKDGKKGLIDTTGRVVY